MGGDNGGERDGEYGAEGGRSGWVEQHFFLNTMFLSQLPGSLTMNNETWIKSQHHQK